MNIFSRELEIDVKNVASPLSGKSFHKNLQLTQENKKQKAKEKKSKRDLQQIYASKKQFIAIKPSNPSYN